MQIDTDEIVAIIMMTMAFTAFVVSCGYAWRDYEAKLLICRQEDEINELRYQLHPSSQQTEGQQAISFDATEMVCYQMLCGPVVTLFNGRLIVVKNGIAYPRINLIEQQVRGGCEKALECQHYARNQLEWTSIANATQ